MRNDTADRKPIVGLLTLLVVFSVLCLTILSVLSFSTAKYERVLAQKNAEANTAYYNADYWCTEASNELFSLWKNGDDLSDAAKKIGADISSNGEDSVISFACQIDDTKLLSVSITAGSDFSVTKWSVVPYSDWQADESLHVWVIEDD